MFFSWKFIMSCLVIMYWPGLFDRPGKVNEAILILTKVTLGIDSGTNHFIFWTLCSSSECWTHFKDFSWLSSFMMLSTIIKFTCISSNYKHSTCWSMWNRQMQKKEKKKAWNRKHYFWPSISEEGPIEVWNSCTVMGFILTRCRYIHD